MNGMMKKMKKWLACGAIVTASAVLLAGCGGQNTDKSSGSAAGSGDKIVAYGVIDPQISAQQIIADKKGYFKEEGLNVGRIVKLSATPLRNRPHMVFCSQGTS